MAASVYRPNVLPTLLSLLVTSSCAPSTPAPGKAARANGPSAIRHEFTHPALQASARVVVYCPDEAAVRRAEALVVRRLARLDEVFDDSRPSSEVAQVHANAGLGAVRVSDDLYALLRQAQRLVDRTRGASDVTAGAVAEVWERSFADRRLPSGPERSAALQLTGRDRLRLDPIARTAHLTEAGMRLDLRTLGQGYACDRVLATLESAGFDRALVEIGDAIAVGEAPPGRAGWRIEVRDAPPKSPRRYVTLKDQAVASSGRAGDGVTIDGTRYARLPDPRTGIGGRDLAPVTVVSRRAWHATAIARAASVLGVAEGGRLLKSTPNVRGWFHDGDGGGSGTGKKKSADGKRRAGGRGPKPSEPAQPPPSDSGLEDTGEVPLPGGEPAPEDAPARPSPPR
jgi:thiamine biosynthesis lipoprotein